MRNEANIPSKTFLGFTEKEEINKPSNMANPHFAHLFRTATFVPISKNYNNQFNRLKFHRPQCMNEQILSNTMKTRVWRAYHKKFGNHCFFHVKLVRDI